MRLVCSAFFALLLMASSFAWAKTAVIKTTEGDITVKLFGDKSPFAVMNFVGLSTGSRTWKDPKTGKPVEGRPLYNGTVFHRVIPGFMIQGGDPNNDNTGSAGYTFVDEFYPSLKFDRPGILAMANGGPNTNSCQFFITTAPTPHLNGKHTIFGEVTDGLEVVRKISEAPRGVNDRPVDPVKIKKILIQD